MKFKIVLLILLLLPTLANAQVLCSYEGSDASNDSMILKSFIVTGPADLVSDTVKVEIKIQSYGQKNITLGTKGIFVAARDPSNKDVSFGFTYQRNVTFPGQLLTLTAYRSLGKAGNWSFWPSYTILVSNRDKLGPVWHVCTVNISDIKDWDRDGIPDDKDNCKYKYNLDQNDSNKNGIGDACEQNTTQLIIPLKQYRLPCSISGKIYNFSYGSDSIMIRFCEVDTLKGTEITKVCKPDGATWYQDVVTDYSFSMFNQTFELMNVSANKEITVNISNWWKNLESDIDADPISGFLRYFWLDENGTICYGEVGKGLPTYNYLIPSKMFTDILPLVRYSGASINLDELRSFQTDTYNFSTYNISGKYIFQYAAHMWRLRSDGSMIEGWPAWLSLPMDGYLEDYVSPGYIQPVAVTQKLKECFSEFGPPSTVYPVRDTKKCNIRKNITASDLIQACLDDRLEGGFEKGYFKILNKTKTITKPALKYSTLASCNESYLIQPVCKGTCIWNGSWIPNKSNFVSMNDSSQSGYDFTFIPKVSKEESKNIIDDFWSGIVSFFQSIFAIFHLK